MRVVSWDYKCATFSARKELFVMPTTPVVLVRMTFTEDSLVCAYSVPSGHAVFARERALDRNPDADPPAYGITETGWWEAGLIDESPSDPEAWDYIDSLDGMFVPIERVAKDQSQ